MTVLITGSRGKVATTLIPLLREQGITVRAASASPDKLVVPDGVERVVCDLDDPATFPAALTGVESVFLYANPQHIEAFLAEAKAAGVQHIVLLSSSSVLEPGADTNAIAAMHSAVERGLERSGIQSTFLRPGGFAGNALGWSWAAKSTGTVDLPYPETQASPIHEADIAEAALAVLTRPELRGQAYHLTGPASLTAAEQVAAVAEAAGRPLTVTPVSAEAWKQSMAEFMPAGVADALLDYFASHEGHADAVTQDVEQLTGHPARTFESWARENADAFRP
ncbi:NAD(P)H-binding protein [Streptomyces sp. NBC_00083]|uniref:NAD(P)H-binding protein n=1 Tax=Streptomyces sp. NBC_00083 TaxID=2975647 RepID=UPI002251777C|nr:NAD(P)H-binding protein [Streptomyces sp. NBC_00083]MCX5384907.1 NAD(P)H-binding protein [Streptomyces sp. NBC_00083]